MAEVPELQRMLKMKTEEYFASLLRYLQRNSICKTLTQIEHLKRISAEFRYVCKQVQVPQMPPIEIF